MTNEEILQAAKEAGLVTRGNCYYAVCHQTEIKRFAAIIEKRMIERCANECNKNLIDQITYAEHAAIKKCAAAIRKLGE